MAYRSNAAITNNKMIKKIITIKKHTFTIFVIIDFNIFYIYLLFQTQFFPLTFAVTLSFTMQI